MGVLDIYNVTYYQNYPWSMEWINYSATYKIMGWNCESMSVCQVNYAFKRGACISYVMAVYVYVSQSDSEYTILVTHEESNIC